MIKLLNKKIVPKLQRKIKRKRKIRAKIHGTEQKLRLTIYRSNRNIFAQAIDDNKQDTVCAISSIEKEMERKNVTVESVKSLAQLFAQRLKEANVNSLVFDRNGLKFHGVIRSFVDTLRSNEIKI